jgi:hypothetical protein
MNQADFISQRLHNHRLSFSQFQKPAEIVRWMGAVQAQDYNAAKWALALRMKQATDHAIEDAFNRGEILRTHLMRPTWHFVAPEDIRWLLKLTAPRVNIRSGPNYRKLELDTQVFNRSNKALSRALKGDKHLTRSALKTVLNEAGVDARDSIRLAHILLRAELDGVVCSGPRLGKQFTYALLEERVARTKPVTRDEALAELTRRYFTSHGPATLQDFVWWSGLSAADARHGITHNEKYLERMSIEDKVYWGTTVAKRKRSSPSTHLLPAYDEYFVAYKDRQMGWNPNDGLTTWDLLGPTIISNGTAIGTWKRTDEKNSVTISFNPSGTLNPQDKLALAKAVDRYATFLNVPVYASYLGEMSRRK